MPGAADAAAALTAREPVIRLRYIRKGRRWVIDPAFGVHVSIGPLLATAVGLAGVTAALTALGIIPAPGLAAWRRDKLGAADDAKGVVVADLVSDEQGEV